MSELTSPEGSIAVAIAALLLVLGFRFARPSRPREGVAVAAYAAGLLGPLLGASGLLRGSVLPATVGPLPRRRLSARGGAHFELEKSGR